MQLVQTFDGIASARGGSLGLAVRKDGSVLSYTGETVRSGSLLGSFQLSSADALKGVAGSLADALSFVPSRTGTQAGYDVFAKGPFAASSYVKKVAFPTADGARAAYSVLFVEHLDEGYQVVVDAETGKQLYRSSLVQHESGGTIYDNYPGAPAGGQPRHVSFGPNDASPGGYVDPTGLTGLGITTFGNNANAHANWSNFEVPADQGPRPVSPTVQFDYRFADHWGTSKCDPTSYPLDQEAASTNLFYQHNRIHDEYYRLGFTESGGNFQLTNQDPDPTTGGNPGDAIQGLVQAGAVSGGNPTYTGRDNAYMLTLPDGIPPWSGMFLWEPIDDAFEGPCADGDFDAGVIQHEYSHGLSNRYVGTEDGSLGTHQSGSMGEGWGDWYALDYLHRNSFQQDSVLGGFVTGNKTRGIRNWAYDQNPTTFGDIGYDLVGPEVHADGEIWTATLWQVRKALVAKYGQIAGSDIAEHLVTDAMPLSPNNPSMLDERTAIMTALDDRYHARSDFDALVDTVYSVFAQRGMGLSAHNTVSEADPTGGNDTDGVPGFDNRNPALNGTITGTVLNASTGRPVDGARIMLGRFEARATPIATTGPTGTFRITATQATYPLTVQSRGFGARTFDEVAVTKGRTTTKNLVLAPNLASKTFGAVSVSGDAGAAMDDTEASSWKTTKGGKAVIKLAQESVVSTVQVSAYTSSRFEGLKSFTLQTSTDGVSWKTQDVRRHQRVRLPGPPPGRPGPALQDVHPADADQGWLHPLLGRPAAGQHQDERPGRRHPGVQRLDLPSRPAAPAAARRAGDREVHDRRRQPGQRGLPGRGRHGAREHLHRPAGQPGQRRPRDRADGRGQRRPARLQPAGRGHRGGRRRLPVRRGLRAARLVRDGVGRRVRHDPVRRGVHPHLAVRRRGCGHDADDHRHQVGAAADVRGPLTSRRPRPTPRGRGLPRAPTRSAPRARGRSGRHHCDAGTGVGSGSKVPTGRTGTDRPHVPRLAG